MLDARKKKILEDGRITLVEARELLDAAAKDGFTVKEKQDLRDFFIQHESALEPDARELVVEALALVARKLREQVLADGKVTADEATLLVDAVKRGGVSQVEREELHRLLTTSGTALEPAARTIIEQALGIGVTALARAPKHRDEAELAPLRAALAVAQKTPGKPSLIEIGFAGAQPSPSFVKEIAPRLKAFVSGGKSSLTAAEATELAGGIAGGSGYKAGDSEPFLAGDRLAMTVHYPDGKQAETSGLVVSAGQSPLVLFVNRAGYLQLVRQDPKSREQLHISKITAGRA